MTLTYGSLFSGIGGIDLGLDRAGMTPLWRCEIDQQCRQVLAYHWPDQPCHPDVRMIDERTPAVDVLCGGFPCQDLSVAGNRAGLAGSRSGLFHEFMRVAAALTPTWVLVENVPGLLSSNSGRDMGTVLGCLADLGYGWAYRVLDAQYFGVAQRRRRVFIVGCADNPAGAAQILFEPESCDGDPAPRREPGTGVAALTANGVGTGGADDNQAQAGHLIPALARCLTAGERWDGDTETFVAVDLYNQEVTGDVAHTLRDGNGAGTPAVIAYPIQDVRGITKAQNGTGVGVAADPAYTLDTTGAAAIAFSENQRGELIETGIAHQLTTGGGKPGQGYPAVRQGMTVRRLLPVECERLQGFPDGWTDVDGMKDSVRYRMLGNAVAVPVAEWIGRRIMAAAA